MAAQAVRRVLDLGAYLSFVGTEVSVVIDRPAGSRHPSYELVYPLPYGWIPDTVAGDGEPVDAYIVGASRPQARYFGRCVAVVERRDDVEMKLIVSVDRMERGEAELTRLVAFQERFFTSRLHMIASRTIG